MTRGGFLLCWVDQDSAAVSASRVNRKEGPERLVMSAVGPAVDGGGAITIPGPVRI